MEYQHIYLYMDDSGKISKNEDIAVYAGIVFSQPSQLSEFKNKYRSINTDIKCKYCNHSVDSCLKECPEIKAVMIKEIDRRRLMNLSKSYITFCAVIYNQNIQHEDILTRPASKGRFTEYAQRRLIKQLVSHMIDRKIIDPNQPVFLHINIDEMPTKTNGYYTLEEGIREELINGIKNFNYGISFKPILFGQFKIQLIYRDSKKDFYIQMADIIANTVRRSFVFNSNYYETRKYLKEKQKINIILRLPD